MSLLELANINIINEFIDNLKRSQFKKCDLQKNYGNINVPLIQQILNKKFIDGNSMSSILCFFDMFLYFSSDENDGIHLNESISKWITMMEQFGKTSVMASVYLSQILGKDDLKVIIKLPQKFSKKYENNIRREYFIGMYLNKLRYKIPNFVYTFGLFKCKRTKESNPIIGNICKGKKTPKITSFLINEKITGISMYDYIMSDNISTDIFFNIFAQILLALQIAQDELGFTHFDLHYDNLLLRALDNKNFRNSQYNYKVNYNNDTYNYTAKEYIATIIDFDQACIRIFPEKKNLRFIGSGKFTEYGMTSFMIPGFDMYKIMYFMLNALYLKMNIASPILKKN